MCTIEVRKSVGTKRSYAITAPSMAVGVNFVQALSSERLGNKKECEMIVV
jgi:hypothetical protein